MIISPDPNPTTTSNVKQLFVKEVQISRTTTASTVLAVLPADATILFMVVRSTAVSDAGTTATISLGNLSSATAYINALNVKTTPAANTPTMVVQSNLGNISGIPLGSDQQVVGVYAESGTASTAGGPWVIDIVYTR